MKTGKYTAVDLLKEAGVTNPGSIFGKTRVVIGGVSTGRADHVLRIPEGTKTLEVIVGDKPYSIKVK